MDQRLSKWRLILGRQADPNNDTPLEGQEMQMDKALEALYDSDRKAGLGSSSPSINRWLGDIRNYFPSTVVQIMQKDALERLGLEKMLLEPELLEHIEADVELVGTLLSLNKVMPSRTKETARQVVRKVVEELQKKLRSPMREAIQGALQRSVRNRRPKHQEIDWKRTIRHNLKHYQKEYKTIIPHQLIGYGRKGQALKEVFLAVDQSGSMASSVVYASIFGAVLASLPSIKTQMVVFDTSVADLTAHLEDPVDLLFGTQLGGGTDISKALGYMQKIIARPSDSILVLVTDLYEGGNEREMLRRIAALKAAGTQVIVLLALNDEGAPTYDRHLAAKLGALQIPAFACTPSQFPDLMAAAIQKVDLQQWLGKKGMVEKS